jgi:hypothetical protein
MPRVPDFIDNVESIRRSRDGYDVPSGIREILAALADVELEYEIACERLDAWLAPATAKESVAATLLRMRHVRRAPLEASLRELQRELVQNTGLH